MHILAIEVGVITIPVFKSSVTKLSENIFGTLGNIVHGNSRDGDHYYFIFVSSISKLSGNFSFGTFGKMHALKFKGE